MDTVSIRTLCPTGDLEAGLAGGSVFAPLVAAQAPATPRPFWLLRDGPWRRHVVPPQLAIGPLGLHWLRDVTLCGSGYVFSGDRFIREFAHTSDVALQWLQRPDFPDNPRSHPPVDDRVINATGLIVFGPGFPIYGHWLLDFLPRLALARLALGDRFESVVIPLPDDVPDWLFGVLEFFVGVSRAQTLSYNRSRDRLLFRSACLPSFAHDGEHALHPFATSFYRSFVHATGRPPSRRICLSRRNFEAGTRSAWRVFESRARCEDLAIARGYEIVCPEDLDLAGQISLFADAWELVGEFGSAMHNAIFSAAGTRVGCFPLNNAIQTNIAAACGHDAFYIDRQRARTDDRRVVFFDIEEADLVSMFELMERPA